MVEKVYLLRHGHIDNGDEKKYLGQTDISLSVQGEEHASALRDYFKDIPIDAMFTSPLKRCVQTSQIICETKDITYKVVEAFTEIDMGEWENVAMSSIKAAFPKLYAKRGEDLEYFTPPKGESFHALAKRVRKAFDAIVLNTKGTILIVAHAGVNRMILSNVLGLAINDMFRIEQPYACINELTWNEQTMQWEYRKI